MNILSLDLGKRKVGVALTKQGIVFERPKIEFENHDKLINCLDAICRENEVDEIVVGIPKSTRYPEQAEKNKIRAEKISQELNLPVKLVDEQFTSVEAQRKLKEQGLSPEQIHDREDSFAARLILEEYLNEK